MRMVELLMKIADNKKIKPMDLTFATDVGRSTEMGAKMGPPSPPVAVFPLPRSRASPALVRSAK